jgi:hypothetical protein
MQTDCTALAKVVVNERLNTIRIIFTFDKYNKVTVKNAAYVTGDLCRVDYEHIDAEIARAVRVARDTLRCAHVQFVAE